MDRMITVIGLVAVAIFEAWNEGLKNYPDLAQKLPTYLTLHQFNYVPTILLFVVFAVWLYRLVRERVAGHVKIEILNPCNGFSVTQRDIIQGSISPAGHPLQVLILSRNGLWYPQEKPEHQGRLWSATGYFGSAEQGEGGSYQIIALAGESPVKERARWLPLWGRRSNRVTVVRQRRSQETVVTKALENRR